MKTFCLNKRDLSAAIYTTGYRQYLICWLAILSLTAPGFPPPPGTKKVSNNLFVDKNPIRYIDYYEFLYYLQLHEPAAIPLALPADTTLTYGADTLWRNERYDEFPIAGLSTDQMLRYCAWRSDRVNEFILAPHKRCGNFKYWRRFDSLDPDKKYRVVYTLPSRAELSRAKVKSNPYGLPEYTLDGVLKGNKAKYVWNDSSLVVFRCKAEYIAL